MTKIEVGKTYLQNNGAKVRILAIDLKNEKSVLGLVLCYDGTEYPRTYYSDGVGHRDNNSWNLIIPPERKSRWLNWYGNNYDEIGVHETREDADLCAELDSRTHVLEIITEDGKPVDVKIHEEKK